MLERVNGVLLKPRSGAFGKSVRRKLKNIMFFGTGSTFSGGQFAKVACAWARSKERGGVKVGSAGSCVLAQGEPKKNVK